MLTAEIEHLLELAELSKNGKIDDSVLAAQLRLLSPSISASIKDLVNESELDGLTKLYRQKPFLKHLDEQRKVSIDHEGENSIIVADIDNFKQYNDKYGHEQGNIALEKLAEVMTSSVRQSDKVARYGGEEFAFSLPQTGIEEALKMAERIRSRIEQTIIRANELRVFSDTDYAHRTVSLGVATYNFGLDDFLRREYEKLKAQNSGSGKTEFDATKALFDCGDIALYHAKSGGKNRVVKYVPGMIQPDKR